MRSLLDILKEVLEKLKALTTSTDKKTEINLLWTNPNPTENFVAQTITFQRNGYSNLLLTARDFASTTDIQSVIIPNVVGTTHQFQYIGANADAKYWRRVAIVANGLNVAKGTYGSGSATDNQECIPYQIYGIKSGGGS